MNIEEILSLHLSAVELAKDALYYVLDSLPEQTYSFKHEPRLPFTESFSGEMYNVSVVELYIMQLGKVHLMCRDEYGGKVLGCLDDFNDDAAYWLLQYIDKDTLNTVSSYHPQPQTLLVTGIDNVNEYERVLGHESDDELRDFIRTFKSDIIVRTFCTPQERNAYIRGVGDATGYDTYLIDNDNGHFDIDL